MIPPQGCHTFQVLDNPTQAIAMSSNKDSLSLFDLWDNFLVPERQSPSDGVLQALACRQLVLCQVSVATVLGERPCSRSSPTQHGKAAAGPSSPLSPPDSLPGDLLHISKDGLGSKKALLRFGAVSPSWQKPHVACSG